MLFLDWHCLSHLYVRECFKKLEKFIFIQWKTPTAIGDEMNAIWFFYSASVQTPVERRSSPQWMSRIFKGGF